MTAQDRSYRTPLHVASSWVSAIAVLLFWNSVEVNGQDMFDYEAKAQFQEETVKLLINHGADVTAQDETLRTPLHLAAFSGSTKIVLLLIEHGADVSARDRRKKTPLHFASSYVSFRTGSLLIWHRHDSNGQYDRDFTRDCDYVYDHFVRVENVRLLIKNGADVKAQDETHSTPLHMASSSGFPRLVALLIEHGADVTARDRRQKTPLHLASSWVGSRIALLFIEYMSDRNEQDSSHGDSEHWDVSEASLAKANTVRLLIDHGAGVTARDESQSTPLHLASKSSLGRGEVVQLLIEHGADVTAIDANRRTPLHLASSRVSTEA